MTATYKYYRSTRKGYAEMVSKVPTEEVSCIGKELQDLEKCSGEEEAGKDKMCKQELGGMNVPSLLLRNDLPIHADKCITECWSRWQTGTY